jgi:hypothetical protein
MTVVVVMAAFLLLRLLVTLFGQANMLSNAKDDADRGWAIVGMIMTGVAAFCVIYLASH